MLRHDAERQLHQLGYPTLMRFAQAFPTATESQLAGILGFGLAPAMITLWLRDEARRRAQLDWFARDAMVRCLHQFFPDGWRMDRGAESKRALTYACWAAVVGEVGREKSRALFSRLRRTAYEGWLPLSAEDPMIRHIFTGVRFASHDLQ